MATVTLHGPGFSTYTRSARLALEEKGVEYELDEINFIADGMPAEQIARHPFGKVPALTHDGFVVYEVCAIGRYVDDNVAMVLRFADGSVGTLLYSANGDGAMPKERVELRLRLT